MTPEFDKYIAEVLKYVKWRKAHTLVMEDVEENLLFVYDSSIANGLDHQQAVQAALDSVGPSEEIGREYNLGFRPRHAKEVMAVVFIFAVYGLVLSGLSDKNMASLAINIITYILAFAFGYKVNCIALVEHQKAVYCSYIAVLGVAVILEVLHILSVSSYIFTLFPIVFSVVAYRIIQANKASGAWCCIPFYFLPALLYMAGTENSQALPTLLACATTLYIALDRSKVGFNRLKMAVLIGAVTLAAAGAIIACMWVFPHTSLDSLDPSGYSARREELSAAFWGLHFLGSGRMAGSPAPFIAGDTLLIYIAQILGSLGLAVVLVSWWLFFQYTINRIKVTVSNSCSLLIAAVLSQFLILSVLYLLGNMGLGLISTNLGFPLLSPGLPAAVSLFISGIMLAAIRDGFILYD